MNSNLPPIVFLLIMILFSIIANNVWILIVAISTIAIVETLFK